MYGAKGDGVTNDLTAFNLAINAVSDGDVIYVPNGTYLDDTFDHRQKYFIYVTEHCMLSIVIPFW